MDIDITVAMEPENLFAVGRLLQHRTSQPNKTAMNAPFPTGDRTYYVSDERLLAFKQLTSEQKLKWQEEIGTFLRLAKMNRAQAAENKKPADISRTVL